MDATPPLLKAFARAGSDVTIEWTNIIRMHAGPIMTVGPHLTSVISSYSLTRSSTVLGLHANSYY
jgi:hypothetical protein